jgi:hypothetical protein
LSAERRRRWLRWQPVAHAGLGGLAAAAMALALGGGSAQGGLYKVAQCHPGFDVGRGAAGFQRTSGVFRGAAACGARGRGLEVEHMDGRAQPGRFGRWRIEAPVGAVLERMRARASARGAAGYHPSLVVDLFDGGAAVVPGIAGGVESVSWEGIGKAVAARLACARTSERCGKSTNAFVGVKRMLLTLRDHQDPRIRGLHGSLLAGGTQRGSRMLIARASDVGGGVRRVLLLINGKPVGATDLARTGRCALRGEVGTKLTPCPLRAAAGFRLDTSGPSGTARPFRQGPNMVRVCASDQGLHGTANSDCARRQVWIDNACPVGGDVGVRGLSVRFEGGGKTPQSVRVRQGKGATIRGTARSAGGTPIQGAPLCVGQRLDRQGMPERIVRRVVRTNRRGKFRVHLRPGGSRLIRVAHWSAPNELIERRLHMRVAAKPRLRLSPNRRLRNGETLHFHVKLRGSFTARKRVSIRVKPPGGGWQLVSRDCIGRTRSSGRFDCRYRFQSTTARRTYAFRAFVPKQRGYPYAGGHSVTRRQTVVGP